MKKSQSVPNMHLGNASNDLRGGFNPGRQSLDTNNNNSLHTRSTSLNFDQRSLDNSSNHQRRDGRNQEKTIVSQVRKLDPRQHSYNWKKQQIQDRIISTMLYWDLYNNEQIQDAISALKMLYQYAVIDILNQKWLIRQLFSLIGTSSVPMQIRYSIACNINLILKNMSFKRTLIEDPIEAHVTLRPMYSMIIETFQKGNTKPADRSEEDLHYECFNIMATIMSLDMK